MANDEELLENEEDITVELELEDGSSVNCAIITILTVNEKDYIALLPMLDEEDEAFELKFIDDDDVYEAVSDAFEEFLDTQEFDEIIDDDAE